MTRNLSRLFRPKSIAVIGGGAWCQQVIVQCEKMGYDGVIWPVHPNGVALAGHQVFPGWKICPVPPTPPLSV